MEYLEREFKEWDKTTPVYSEKLDQYFFTVDELSDYCYDEELDETDLLHLRLLLCEPNYLNEIDFNNHWCDVIPDNYDSIDDVASKELLTAMGYFNSIVRHHKPVSWNPGKYRINQI